MPTYDTPDPITVTISVLTADVRVRAGEGTDTVVTVAPGDPDDDEDVEAAASTRAELVDGALEIRAPRPWRRFRWNRTGGALEITLDVPTGSALHLEASIADVRVDGRLGTCRLASSTGAFTLDETGPLRASTYGEVTVDRVEGLAEVTGGRAVRIGRVDGDAELRNQNGEIRVGEVTGALSCRTANGPITVDVAGDRVAARSADGDLRVGDVSRGEVDLTTSHGTVEIGIRPGTAARLDVATLYGRLRNELEPADGPADDDRTAAVRARTSHGDVVVTRPRTTPGSPS